MIFNATSFAWKGELTAVVRRTNGRVENLGVVDSGWNIIHRPTAWWKDLWRTLRREGIIPLSVGFGYFLSWMLQDQTGSGILFSLITTAGVDYAAGDFANNGNDVTNFKYMGIGTGTNAPVVGDTDLQTPIASLARVTGSQSKPGSRQFRVTGTITADATYVVAEFGLWSSAGAGSPPAGGTLWDRRLFTPTVGLNNLDSVTPTYTATLTAGGT